ncbi:hypothetical protein D3C81_467080 [compost metagenome]
MSSFTRANATIAFDREASLVLEKNHWRNIAPFRYYIGEKDSNEWIDVPAGILSDGATVPFPVNALIPAWGSYGQAVLLHDYLCNTYVKKTVVNGAIVVVKIDRAEIDRILSEAMQVLKVEEWRRLAIMTGVNGYRLLTRPSAPRRNPARIRLEANFDPNAYT